MKIIDEKTLDELTVRIIEDTAFMEEVSQINTTMHFVVSSSTIGYDHSLARRIVETNGITDSMLRYNLIKSLERRGDLLKAVVSSSEITDTYFISCRTGRLHSMERTMNRGGQQSYPELQRHEKYRGGLFRAVGAAQHL